MYKFIRRARVPFVTLMGMLAQFSYWHDYNSMEHVSSALIWIVIVSAAIPIVYIIAQLTRDTSTHNQEADE